MAQAFNRERVFTQVMKNYTLIALQQKSSLGFWACFKLTTFPIKKNGKLKTPKHRLIHSYTSVDLSSISSCRFHGKPPP